MYITYPNIILIAQTKQQIPSWKPRRVIKLSWENLFNEILIKLSLCLMNTPPHQSHIHVYASLFLH